MPGPSVEKHHLIPRSQGGRVVVALHTICHRKIHAELDERTLARAYADIDALRAHPAIADFIRWVSRKPPEFILPTYPRRR